MRKKSRLFLSMASMVLTVALFCFGVYAALGVSYTISGSVVYQVKDVFVNIQTSLYVSTSESLTDQDTLDKNVATFEGGDDAQNTQKLSYTDGLSTYNPDTGVITNSGEAVSKTSKNIPINYGSYEIQNKGLENESAKGFAYYIVVSITNYGTEGVSVTLTNNIDTQATNSLTKLSENTTIEGRTEDNTYTTKHVVIGMALNDATKSVGGVSFNVPILIERDVPPEPTLDKLTFSLINEDNAYEVKAKDSLISGEVVIPSTYNGKTVTSIGHSAFKGCDGLTEITIPDSVETIGGSAFSGCTFTAVNYTTSGEGYSFNNGTLTITSMTDSPVWYSANINPLVLKIVWNCELESIGSDAFYGCTSLTQITIPENVQSIGSSAFSSCTSLTEILIPNNLESIGMSAFSGCTSLTEITIGSGVQSIGSSAFSGCTSLTKILIPNNLESLGSYAFSGCSSLTEITIGSGVQSIGSNAFSFCNNLASVIIKGNIPASLADEGGKHFQFMACHEDLKIYVPAGSGETYKTATGWSTWADKIVEVAS